MIEESGWRVGFFAMRARCAAACWEEVHVPAVCQHDSCGELTRHMLLMISPPSTSCDLLPSPQYHVLADRFHRIEGTWARAL